MHDPALKLNVLICHPSYGGNGGVSSEHPDIRDWAVETMLKLKADPRIGRVHVRTEADTPITMVRNKFITVAKQLGCHLVLMVDSDQSPNKHKGEKWFKPFWDEAFSFIYENYHKGPRLVFAPYCGPPNGEENVYVFQWHDRGNKAEDESEFSLEMYTRAQAAIMTGIQEAAAGPTGMILIDMRLMELIEPSYLPKREVLERVQQGIMPVDEALMALKEGYFYYEWANGFADEKASTEDVTFTRDISLAGIMKLGYNPVFCAWDSWVGHWKPWNVGKPRRYTAESVSAVLSRAAVAGRRANEVAMEFESPNDELQALADKALARALTLPPGHEGREKVELFGPTIRYVQELKKNYNETVGPWDAHGHAPPEHCKALSDLVFDLAYRRQKGPVRVLEVGSWLGTTAIAMADAHDFANVHCVDTWEGTPTDCTGEMAKAAGGADAVYAEFVKRIGDRLDRTIFPWRQSSADASKKHWTPFDLIFIDADHTYEGCRADILNWWKHLYVNGVMCGHDFECVNCYGVTEAVKDIFGDMVETTGWTKQGSIWVVRKERVMRENPDLHEALRRGDDSIHNRHRHEGNGTCTTTT